jgi:hypothetical protein
MESLRVLDRETVPLPCNRELPRTPFSRTSENTPSETVWKIAMGSEIGVPEAAKRDRKSPDRPPFAAQEARSRGLQLFSKQFLHALR